MAHGQDNRSPDVWHDCPVEGRHTRLYGKYTLASGEPIRMECPFCDYSMAWPRHPDYDRESTFQRLMADIDPNKLR